MSTAANPSEYRKGQAEVASAAAALRAGKLAIIPTETVYGVAASTAHPAAIQLLLSHAVDAQPTRPSASTWHAPSAELVIKTLRITHPLHLRMFARLAPGPIRFLVQKKPEELEAILAELGLKHGVIDRAGEFSVRIPDHPMAREVLEQVPGVVIADRLGAFGLGDGKALPEDIQERAAKMGITAVVDDGPTRLGRPSTAIHLGTDGSFEVVPGGLFDERYIRRKIDRVVLFVCTGNTCRSPMAEALARDAIMRIKSPIPTRVISAGVAAGGGEPMTREARDVLGEMHIEVGPHRAKALTRDMLQEAEVVYGMTRSHVQAVKDIAPSLADKVQVLDPSGQDVKDPIGGSLDEYRSTAEKLRSLVEKRLRELDAPKAQADRSSP